MGNQQPNKTADFDAPTSTSTSKTETETPLTTEELVNGRNTALAKLIVSYQNWTSKEDGETPMCTLRLTGKSPIEGLTVAQIAEQTLDLNIENDRFMIVPIPNARGKLQDCKIIKFNPEYHFLVGAFDVPQAISISKASSREAHRTSGEKLSNTEPTADIDAGAFFDK